MGKEMNYYTNKEELRRRLKAAYDGSVFTHGDEDNLFADGLEFAIDILNDMPYSDVAPVIHAHWEDWVYNTIDGKGEVKAICSRCREPNKQYKPPFCPHCGAKMDEGEMR